MKMIELVVAIKKLDSIRFDIRLDIRLVGSTILITITSYLPNAIDQSESRGSNTPTCIALQRTRT